MRTTTPVEIRAADKTDLEACLHIDDGYTTTYTWQVATTKGEPGAAAYGLNSTVTLGDSPLSVTFRPVKLPRARKVNGSMATLMREGTEAAQAGRLHSLSAADMVLVAAQDKAICGYLALTLVPGSGIGWISALVVAPQRRGQGIGSMLVAALRRWARYEHGHKLRAFMLELPTKNHPAVAFCRKEGFNFCGYTDYSFSNGDLVLLFVSPIVV